MINPFENYIVAFFLTAIVIIAAGCDIRRHKIPNLLTFPSILAALSYYSMTYGWSGFCFSTAGLGVGLALLLLPYLLGGMGAGDAKLMGVIGAGLGVGHTVQTFLFIVTVGCLYALLVMVFQRHRLKGYFGQLRQSACGLILTGRYVPAAPSEGTYPKVYYGIAIGIGVMLYMAVELTGFRPPI